MKRILLACAATVALICPPYVVDMSKTLRVAFQIDITGFDPQATNDAYSGYINREVFDTMYVYDYCVRPVKAKG